MIVGGIFGPKKSGKTTLAQYLASEYWKQEGRRSLVNDPNQAAWGAECWQAETEEKFWQTAWKTRDCLLICDDAAATINRDADLVDVFTRINHCGHKLLVIGHSGGNLLPVMREQMDTLYLFRTSPKMADAWYEIFHDPAIREANTLGQFEFLFVRTWSPTQKLRLTLPEKSEFVPPSPAKPI